MIIETKQIFNWDNLIEQTEHRCEVTQLELNYNMQHITFLNQRDQRMGKICSFKLCQIAK